jgi:hypothetical protein
VLSHLLAGVATKALFASSLSLSQLEERAEQIRSKSYVIRMEREKMQMELSHKRARVELEKAASTSARSYEVGTVGRAVCSTSQAGRNQDPACRLSSCSVSGLIARVSSEATRQCWRRWLEVGSATQGAPRCADVQ